MTKDRNASKIFHKELQDVNITAKDGTRYLGAPIGSKVFKEEFTEQKLKIFNEKIKKLTNLASTSPHSAYYLFHSCIKHEITFLQRTCDAIPLLWVLLFM